MPIGTLLRSKWSMKKFNATVINDIWPQILLFTLISLMVTGITELTSHKLALPNALLTVLGTVLGLVISFRTSSAYERYQEGRTLWSNISVFSRNMAQLIWIHVPNDRIKDSDPISNDPDKMRAERLKAVMEKRSMINLIQAFNVAVKHYLRSEPGIYYEDLYPLISFLPRHAVHPSSTADLMHHDTLPMWLEHERLTQNVRSSPSHSSSSTLSSGKSKKRHDSFDPEKALPRVNTQVTLRPACNPPQPTIYDHIPFLIIFKPFILGPRWLYRRIFKKRTEYENGGGVMGGRGLTGRKHLPPPIDSNVPLEITLFLHSYIQFLLRKDLIVSSIASELITGICSLQDVAHNLERVRSTPIPFAYQAHLRMSLWLYLVFLPFQIVDPMGWFTIPATCFASFLLLGFLEIGQEIENPFNYDENDFDMDSFCLAMQRELHQITAHPAPDPHSYIFNQRNQPFAPADCRNAEDIISDVTHEYHKHETSINSINRTLLRSWRQVEEVTKGETL